MTSTLTDLAGNPVLSVVKEVVVSPEVATPVNRLSKEEIEEKAIVYEKIKRLAYNMQISCNSSEVVFNRYVDLVLKEMGLYEMLDQYLPYHRVVGSLNNSNVHYIGYNFRLMLYSTPERYYEDNYSTIITFKIYELGMNCSSCIVHGIDSTGLAHRDPPVPPSVQKDVNNLLLDLAEHIASVCKYTAVMYTTGGSTPQGLIDYIMTSYKEIYSLINKRNQHSIKYYVKELG